MSSSLVFKASEHAIKSVTVFKSSKAEVVRTFSLLLKKGPNKIEVKGLSGSMDTQSVRVSGFGSARLFDVVCTIDNVNNTHSTLPGFDTTALESSRPLIVKKEILRKEKEIREQEAALLLKYGQTLSGEHVAPTQMNAFLESYVTQGRKTLEAIVALDEKITEVDRSLADERDKVSHRKGNSNGRVDIVLFSDEDEETVDLKLTYIVSNAQWKPTYELHASTESGKPSASVSLFYRARIAQETGEDWTNASLTLSTMESDTIDKDIPQLKRRRILPKVVNAIMPMQRMPQVQQQQQQPLSQMQLLMPQQQQQQQPLSQMQLLMPQQQQQQQLSPLQMQLMMQRQQQQLRIQQAAQYQQIAPQQAGVQNPFYVNQQQQQQVPLDSGAQNPSLDSTGYEEVQFDGDSPTSITENKTIVSETPVSVSFSVHGESTIPSDGIEHQVSVAKLPFAAQISYITIPRLDPRVFLQCKVTNGSEYRLLPGPVTVIFDDSYVSKTSIKKDISTGDSFECTLGDDASTKVTYTRSSKTVKSDTSAFSEITNTTTYNTKISVYNKHQFSINDLIIRESVPISSDKRAKVILRKPEGLAEAKDGNVVDLKNQGLKANWEAVVDGKGGYKEGNFEWKWKVNPGTKVVVEAEWDVKSTGDIEWIEGF